MVESHLLEKMKKGDTASFTVLYNRYWSKVYEFTRLYIISDEDAEEVVQEVFVKLWESREALNTEMNFDGYLFIITRNLIFNKSRRSFNTEFLKITIDEAIHLQSNSNVSSEVVTADLKEYLLKLIDELPPRQKEVFVLSRERQLSHQEIADLLNISTKTIERHITEALKFLKVRLPIFLFAFAASVHSIPVDKL